MNYISYRSRLRTFDVTTIVFLLFLSLLNLIFYSRIPEWWILISINLVVSIGIILGAVKFTDGPLSSPGRWLRDWYPVGAVLLIYKELYYMVYPIRGRDYDELLMLIDQWLFGVNPTEWLARFSHPVLTEFLQIVYASYFFLFLIAGYEMYRRSMLKEFYYMLFLVSYGFFLSYIGYFLVPAIGPRFTIHDYHTMHETLPGLFFTDTIRYLLDAGESIPLGVPNPEDHVQRDVFPSGHVQLTMVLMYFVAVYRLRIRTFILIMGSLLIVSTVYLWYHYVIDIIAGALFCWFTIYTGKHIDVWWEKKKNSIFIRLIPGQ
jgi:membrane-associated phospholipid phosphatase